MRRRANQSRDDRYKSRRDYQTLFEHLSQRFAIGSRRTGRLTFHRRLDQPSAIVCWGGYLRANVCAPVVVTLGADETRRSAITTSLDWTREGSIAFSTEPVSEVTVALEWVGPMALDIWGLSAGMPQLAGAVPSEAERELLLQHHLIPETYYLAHEHALELDIVADESSTFARENGAQIWLKKCSYCGRLLPVDPIRLGALAFHKHNAKKTMHQNECRACKKWRINDTFNPKRTTDQLHESSTITRERKLFLREPEILQSIKKRTGEGLKSQVWERFGGRCFRCGKPVALDDFQLDHTRPLAYLWPIDDHATCLCNGCNNEKKEKFPVDFYSAAELERLSRITGLALGELQKKTLNERELKRILRDLPRFAEAWEPRTFQATARKIAELRRDIDIFQILQRQAPDLHSQLMAELAARPPAVDESER